MPDTAATANASVVPWSALAFVLLMLASVTGLATMNARGYRSRR